MHIEASDFEREEQHKTVSDEKWAERQDSD